MNETFFFFMGVFLSYFCSYLKNKIERADPKNNKLFDWLVFQSLFGGFIAFWAYVYYFAKGLFNG